MLTYQATCQFHSYLTQGEARQELVKELHRVKTELFMKMIESGQLPLRPGVKRLITEAATAGAHVSLLSAACTPGGFGQPFVSKGGGVLSISDSCIGMR